MERAFETQPSNAAIQSELQRLYGRRDGVQLPRIRMTRGALAHMYVQGELYPQAISEIKSVLKEDPGRTDMQVLLARAYYRSGAKNDAAEAASAVLRSESYSLDAVRIILKTFRSIASAWWNSIRMRRRFPVRSFYPMRCPMWR
jgi:predicted Zn-dependent protease